MFWGNFSQFNFIYGFMCQLIVIHVIYYMGKKKKLRMREKTCGVERLPILYGIIVPLGEMPILKSTTLVY